MEMYQWLTAILVGGITGFVSHLINNQGKLLLPRRLKTFFSLWVLTDIFTGSLAALLGLVLFDVTLIKEIIKISIVTAISGQTFYYIKLLVANRLKIRKSGKLMRRFKKLTNYCDVSLYFLKIIAIINNKYFLLRRLSEERVFRMTKRK